ncbi:hypothetical protein NG799_13350 [Laspinema sp. D1]|uniref:Uncharacterized protein n=1 Tax=Laspinema palackyanum D2a TaxID=2953684 RepID=A0ABT2MRL3_9CYAN|nr:hypothetical protein [Laspinema sp. D2a]
MGRFFMFMVIRLSMNCTSGPLPLARGGLGWGSSWVIATSRPLSSLNAYM